MAKWEIQAGRGLVRDGIHICNLTWPAAVEDHHQVKPISPVEFDTLARRIVALLNAAEPGEELHKAHNQVFAAPAATAARLKKILANQDAQEVIAATGEIRKPDGSKLECSHSHIARDDEHQGWRCMGCKQLVTEADRKLNHAENCAYWLDWPCNCR